MKKTMIMKKKKLEGLRWFLASCGHACRGIGFAIRSQRNFRIHVLAGVLVPAAAVALRFSSVKLILTLLTVMLVILGELLNTALEFALNLVEARDHPVVRTAKDIAAGGVLLTVFGSVLVGLLLFGPPLWVLIRGCF